MFYFIYRSADHSKVAFGVRTRERLGNPVLENRLFITRFPNQFCLMLDMEGSGGDDFS